MSSLIDSSQEFYEVLNEFPIIKDKLEALKVDIKDLKEGLSIEEYFKHKSYSEDEIDLLVRKFNLEVKQLLKSGHVAIPKMQLDDSQIEITIEEEE